MSNANAYILKVECPGQTGLVAAISGFLAGRGCFITEMKQFDDLHSGRFFCRIEFTTETEMDLDHLNAEFDAEVALALDMVSHFARVSAPMKTLILVSQHDHCLMELLYRQKRGELNIEVTGILSNHPDLEPIAKFYGLGFELLPSLETKLETKAAREKRILQAFKETGSELVILARYMQILSPELCTALAGQCINIHHSFLPGFKGARPYYQAFDRGVKQIGATAHYVTSDLDEGPIIEQEVGRVDHGFEPDDLRDMGRNMENLALSKAVKAHSEHRVFVNGLKTVVLA
ncbi:MAG TPA: formyltetrahydrofolate deformylase [Marinobacterium sp.]|nr:formyltetrahydrofolate deformylase [Marinobacterium sp.]